MRAYEKGRADCVARPFEKFPFPVARFPTGLSDDRSSTVSGCNVAQVTAYRKCAADLTTGFSGHEHLTRHG